MARWGSFGGGFAGGIMAGMKLGSVVKEGMDQSELAEAMKNATTEEKNTVTEINAPDSQKYVQDSETGNYVQKAFDEHGGLTEYGKQIQNSTTENPVKADVVAPQYETKTERVDKQFASPAEKRTAMLQTGIDFWTQKGNTDKALDLQDKMEQHTLRQLQVKGAQRAERQAQEEDDDKKYYQENIAANFHGTRKAKENSAAMADFEKRNAAYQEALKNNPGNPVAAGMPPQKPILQIVSPMEQLQDANAHMQYMNSKGKVSPAEQLQFMQMAKGIQKEVGVDTFKLLHAGDIEGAIKAFEAQGEMKVPEGAKVSSRRAVFKADGQEIPTYELVVTTPDGRQHTFNGAQGLYAMDAADKIIQRAYQNEDLKLKKQQIGMQGAGLALRQAEANRANERWQFEKEGLETKRGDERVIRTIRQGLIDATENGDQTEINKWRQKAIAAGIKFEKPTMEHVAAIDQMGNRAIITNKDTGSARVVDLGSGATKEIAAAGTPANVSFKNEAEAERAKKTGLVKAGDIVTIGGRPARIN